MAVPYKGVKFINVARRRSIKLMAPQQTYSEQQTDRVVRACPYVVASANYTAGWFLTSTHSA